MYLYTHINRHLYCFVFCVLKDQFADTPLMATCKQNHLQVATYLIEQGANINYQDKVVNYLHCLFSKIKFSSLVWQVTSPLCLCKWPHWIGRPTDTLKSQAWHEKQSKYCKLYNSCLMHVYIDITCIIISLV